MTGGITLRRLGPEDAALVLAAGDAVFDHPPRPEETAAFLSGPGNDLIVALAGQRIVGLVSGMEMRHPDKEPQYFIAELGVDEGFRRRGIGTGLGQAILARAAERGCAGGVWLATEADNSPALALYHRLGGRATGGIVVFDWGGVMDD